ncbi:WD repeat-containing protein RUP2-like protein [Tanacetum coccineum]
MGLSHADPVFGASGSDDGTMQIWDPRQEGGKCVGTVEFGSPVCCVEFIQFVDILYRLMCCQKAYDVERTQDGVSPYGCMGSSQFVGQGQNMGLLVAYVGAKWEMRSAHS